MKTKKPSFVSSALIFAVAGIIIKLLGAVYKIFLGQESLLGEVGSPFVSFVYPYYNLLLIIAIAGIPSAVAKVVAEHNVKGEILEKETVFKTIRRFMIFLGFVLAAIFYVATPYIASFLNNDVIPTLRSINLAILVIPYMGAYRGYFQGHGNLKPFAGSQIIEQLGKVVFGLFFAYLFLPSGVKYAAAGSMLGVSIGGVLGTILLILCAKSFKNNFHLPSGKNLSIKASMPIIKKILYYAIPITIGAAVVPLTNIIDTVLVKAQLMKIGYTKEMATILYGYHSFFTISVINFPIILFVSLQVSVLPAVSSLVALNDSDKLGKTIRTALKLTLIVSLASATGLFVLAKPVLMLLWPGSTGMHQVAPDLLRIMSLALIFISIYQCTSGILQGMSLHIKNASNMFFGAVAKGILSYFLLAMPIFGIKGASLSNFVAFFIAASLNLLTLKRRTSVKFNFSKIFIKPLIASIIMGIVVYFVYDFTILILSNTIATILSVLIGGLVYFVLVIKFRMLNRDDLDFIPGKKFLVKFVKE